MEGRLAQRPSEEANLRARDSLLDPAADAIRSYLQPNTLTAYTCWSKACLRGGVRIPTGGDSPRPLGSRSRVDPVKLRDRP
jgi:hypothetical protein